MVAPPARAVEDSDRAGVGAGATVAGGGGERGDGRRGQDRAAACVGEPAARAAIGYHTYPSYVYYFALFYTDTRRKCTLIFWVKN